MKVSEARRESVYNDLRGNRRGRGDDDMERQDRKGKAGILVPRVKLSY